MVGWGAGWCWPGLAGVLAGRLAGHRDPQELRTRGSGGLNGDIGGARTITFLKKPTTNPTLDQGLETRTRD